MRFDPGYYDGPSGGRKKMGYQGSKKKIKLPSKEQVELRKAEKRWVRPVKAEAHLPNTEKETQVSFCWIIYVGVLLWWQLLKSKDWTGIELKT